MMMMKVKLLHIVGCAVTDCFRVFALSSQPSAAVFNDVTLMLLVSSACACADLTRFSAIKSLRIFKSPHQPPKLGRCVAYVAVWPSRFHDRADFSRWLVCAFVEILRTSFDDDARQR